MMYRFMKMNSKFFLAAAVMLCLLEIHQASAQSGTPQQVMARIYRSYDSIKYLSFDVKYTYTSDTLNGDFTHEVLPGTYTLAGKKAKFSLGDIEFMQNDSFFIAVYNNDKFIVVADPRNKNSGSELPMRPVMDSLVKLLDHYTLGITNFGDTAIVKLTKVDSVAKFNTFSLTFDTAQNIIHSIDYMFEESVPVDSAGYSLPPVTRKKRLKIEFSNYHFDDFSDRLYDENNYIFFEDGACKPIDKYNDFRIFYNRTGLIKL